jgi:hypothetical protein
MRYKEVIEAIREVFKEAGLDSLEKDIKIIHERMINNPVAVYDAKKTWNQTATNIENEVQVAIHDGLIELLEDKYRKQRLDTSIPLSFIREISKDKNIRNVSMIKAIIIIFFEIKNGTNRTKALKRLKSTLSIVLEKSYSKSKRDSEEIAKAISFAYFEDKTDSFKNRSGKPPSPVYTDFGYIFKLS